MLLVYFLLVGGGYSYTVEDLAECVPCDPDDYTEISHPTICTGYFFCLNPYQWKYQSCPASTYFSEEDRACVNPVVVGEALCSYDRGINENVNKSISALPQCAKAVETTIGTSEGVTVATTDIAPGSTDYSITTIGPGKVNLTVVLAVLLVLTVVLLLIVVVGILLYRRRQNQRRPRHFYKRELPREDTFGRAGAAAPPGNSTGNAAYLSRSLLKNQRDDRVTSVGYEVPVYEETSYVEMANRSSSPDSAEYTDPSEVCQPPKVLPMAPILVSPSCDGEIYSEAASPCGEVPSEYTQPTCVPTAEDNHVYSAKSTRDSTYADCDPPEDPYDYCQPEVANPSFRRDADEAQPSSPPYYMDPIPDVRAGSKLSYPYHTLEPLSKD
ncbi:uncharacterized protein [Watersipora subatra]|uniref:uncharacterized protein n=1 Tax=Watersipora subatra TaxID=2589382 RepID=UPI00355C6D73